MAEQKRSETRTIEQQQADTRGLLDTIVANAKQRESLVNWGLAEQINKIEDLLPPAFKGHGERLCKRAILTLNRKQDIYSKCSPNSFIRCVLEAAEFGLAIDGKLGHAVPYKGDLQFQPDYKGIVAVAKRNGVIYDCWPRSVFSNDQFTRWEKDGECHYELKQALANRGAIIGVITIVVRPDKTWRDDWMSIEDIFKIRARSASYQSGKNSPWKSDEEEMCKKTGVKRIMKMYADDPALTRLLEIDDREYETPEEPEQPEVTAPPVGKFRPTNGRRKTSGGDGLRIEPAPVADVLIDREPGDEPKATPETCASIRAEILRFGEDPARILKNYPGKHNWEDLDQHEAEEVLEMLRNEPQTS
jgi:phage RecT family recombinase